MQKNNANIQIKTNLYHYLLAFKYQRRKYEDSDVTFRESS